MEDKIKTEFPSNGEWVGRCLWSESELIFEILRFHVRVLDFGVSVIWKDMIKGEDPPKHANLPRSFSFQQVAVPGMGLQSMWYISYETLYFPRPDSEQVPWGKGEKHFVKRVKCATNCYRTIILNLTYQGEWISLLLIRFASALRQVCTRQRPDLFWYEPRCSNCCHILWLRPRFGVMLHCLASHFSLLGGDFWDERTPPGRAPDDWHRWAGAKCEFVS